VDLALEADNDGIQRRMAPGASEADARSIADRIIAVSSTYKRIIRSQSRSTSACREHRRWPAHQAGAQAISAASLSMFQSRLATRASEAERQLWREWWEEHRPESTPTPDLLGPLTVPINFSGPTPVGGWAQLTIRRSGGWTFSGGLRDFGLPSYDDAVVFVVKNLGTDESYHCSPGSAHGTSKQGRMTSWDESGATPCWPLTGCAFLDGHHWHCRVKSTSTSTRSQTQRRKPSGGRDHHLDR
jgi:hypothetical protein